MQFVTVRLHNGVTLSSGAANTLVSYALRRSGRAGWGLTSIELFSGGSGETLLIARPSAGIEVQFADYALPLLRKYFTN